MSEVSHSNERYLVFSLSEEKYGVELPKVKEVIAMTETTNIPHAPDYFLGIMNLRGQVISVIDLRTKFKMPPQEPGPETAIIILDLKPFCVGVVVDSVNSVAPFSSEEVSEPPKMETHLEEKVFKGVAHSDDGLVLLLDIEAALDMGALKNLSSQLEEAAA